MTAEQLPRVWTGDVVVASCWWWDECRQWLLDDADCQLIPGTIFVPGAQPKPVDDPAEMDTIATCKAVDWA